MSSPTERETTQPAAEMAEVETEKQERQPQAGASEEREPAFVAESSATAPDENLSVADTESAAPSEMSASPEAADAAIPSAVAEAAPSQGEAESAQVETTSFNATESVAAAATADATDGRRLEAGATDGEISAETMEQLIDQYSVPQQAAAEGQIIEAQVIALDDRGIFVSLGGKTEALIPAQEFADGETPIFKPGETVEVQLTDDSKDGMRIVSYQRAHRRRVWQKLDEVFKNNETVTGKVVDRIKGGLVVDVGVRAFLPASQADVRPIHNIEAWLGRELPVRVLKLNRKRGNVVVSHRVLLEEELKVQREALMESLSEGAVLVGKVKNLTDYGAFVDLGGIDGLLHVTDMSWGRVAKPSDALQAGDEIEVVVLKFDKEKARISLGRKQLLPDPWQTIAERFPVGSRVQGKVMSVTDYGAFIELEQGVEGLVHVSEMSWSKRTKHPSKIVNAGDTVEVVVLDIKLDQRRMSLGLKQTTEDPWAKLADKYPVGATVTGTVRNLTDFGAFVEVEEGIDGLIHVSDISWTERVKHPSESFKKGDTVEAKVLKIDGENRRLSLGVKQLNDTWADWFTAHQVGEVVRGKVTRAVSFGVFVELTEGIEGLCHISEIEGRRDRERDRDRGRARPQITGEGKLPGGLEIGGEYDFKVVKLNSDTHKIGLSYRSAKKQAERKEVEEYRSSKSSSTATIGDLIMAKRKASARSA
ncbi:MAG: 30S ribosomal protein S1 [Candidatus Acidiferrales bacterium]